MGKSTVSEEVKNNASELLNTPIYPVISSTEVKKLAPQKKGEFSGYRHECEYHYTPRIPITMTS